MPGITAAYHFTSGQSGTFAAGYSDLEKKIRMIPQSRMLAASIGKTFVGATVLYLENQGDLSREEYISKYLQTEPWLKKISNNSLITTNHLLIHTSGIADYVSTKPFLIAFNKRWSSKKRTFTTDELIEFSLLGPSTLLPGKEFIYSDTGYLLLGKIIEKTSNEKYYDIVDRIFLQNLELKNTSPLTGKKIVGLASGYQDNKGSPLGLPHKTSNDKGELVWNPSFEWTGGGLVSTSEDLAKWGATLFSGSALPFNYLDNLLNIKSTEENKAQDSYGLGVAVKHSKDFGKVYGHKVSHQSGTFTCFDDNKLQLAFLYAQSCE
ncbi:MAG: beta-lactamase family protein [Bdellovibrionaceae bacterium]|nr:beta-lactamase family protein [Pseudobdellovibrionaceae bacterium]